jgi:hypothetical protein
LRGFLAAGLGAKISADARGLSAIIVVSGTFGDECLDDRRSVPRLEGWRARAREEGRVSSYARFARRKRSSVGPRPTRLDVVQRERAGDSCSDARNHAIAQAVRTTSSGSFVVRLS